MARVATPGVAVPARPERHRHHLLNTDGQRHPLQNSATLVATVAGVLAAVTAFFASLHAVSTVAGFVGLAVGLWAQMISATTNERVVNVCAMVLSGVGLLFGLGHGGL